ncbi:hypothetical protein Pedsa_0963 [Pseudopedobacter saltans DSM 12145]|uniref:Uncharacterized protein n=1 Tax=Pseudopedobacter saltans (strain ATCC 51119 / DSM 12145 / JCM 21818 / CCUG 39354 / LMG 10337 / NBRC 100064 / NCIMB 13643) TaxID=762903 RepID=F0SAU0_PSESL|nr:hypothetical protein Pedsa_0963 [Pseudopedobacter saltans DSM 12145]
MYNYFLPTILSLISIRAATAQIKAHISAVEMKTMNIIEGEIN